ncbi:hypothetical protein [Dendronalium sp. ChiSLP03b]|uniref:hypothetical protein n=1 Tax=Dendronalium sp. ChiSLP03b TaxID=3075381 RepID=UPI002AD25FC4|nr:hypothetical protein [Dendronalium sp. ChiSLP03b]MDZ8205810.1 hypothetical protein [Dendronalium sp. ChiSLP03b]
MITPDGRSQLVEGAGKEFSQYPVAVKINIMVSKCEKNTPTRRKMPAIVKLQLSLEVLAEAISSLDLTEKRQLQELIEQQIFEAEEALYEDDAETLSEIQAVRTEYKDGKSMALDEYLANWSK